MADLATLIQSCRQEREAFIKSGETSSPACIELFRRAFAGEEAAWEAIFRQVFQDLGDRRQGHGGIAGKLRRGHQPARLARHLREHDDGIVGDAVET